MYDYEKLGAFYLGKEYDENADIVTGNLLLYDSKDLTTHAVCVGMTGSGKTGLCVGLLEEAAIDGIPAIVVDPKGDLSNLLLTFEKLTGEALQPWINRDAAAQKGLTPEAYAEKQAKLWLDGLADWGQDENRILRFRTSAEIRLYTPGSSAGLPVSVLRSFEAPPVAIREDADLMREQVSSTATSLLTLIGIEGDPVRNREHILLTNILQSAWQAGEDLTLEDLIRTIQNPPFSRVGVFEIESFFPSNDRFQLAMMINNLIAGPGFKTWMEGTPLDIGSMLYGQGGKPNIVIFSIAHLSDAERMFFVSMLLNRVLRWIRTQSGTSTLRALLYMDEIFGYMPPVANPPSKLALLTLLKQARAFGLGLVLATQNPADLDYKGLSNAGTWFIGRLQTKRDRDKMLDGLAGTGAGKGGRFDRARMDHLLSRLSNRVFLMNNVHENEPVLFHTRWVMSYLAGPLSREQIIDLMRPYKQVPASRPKDSHPAESPQQAFATTTSGKYGPRPVLKPDITQAFIPIARNMGRSENLVYLPGLYASVSVHYSDSKKGIEFDDRLSALVRWGQDVTPDWNASLLNDLSPEELVAEPQEENASYGALPDDASSSRSYATVSGQLKDWVYREKELQLFHSPELKLTSQPGESKDTFAAQLRVKAHEVRDLAIEKIRSKYASKLRIAEERLLRAQQAVQRESEQATSSRLDVAVSVGSTILGALLGRKKLSSSTLGRASTTISRSGRAMKQAKDVTRAKEQVKLLEERLAELETSLADEIETVRVDVSRMEEEFTDIGIRPRKQDIAVQTMALAWIPYMTDTTGVLTPAFRQSRPQ